MHYPVGAYLNIKSRPMKTIYAYAQVGKFHGSAFAKTNYDSRGRGRQTTGHRQSPYA
jgi:hypothetical protein